MSGILSFTHAAKQQTTQEQTIEFKHCLGAQAPSFRLRFIPKASLYSCYTIIVQIFLKKNKNIFLAISKPLKIIGFFDAIFFNYFCYS